MNLLLLGILTVVFVSSSKGDDSNTGLSVSQPVRTIARAREIGGEIKLRKGDVFYEYLRGKDFSLSAYGACGKRPVICGFRIIPAEASGRLWERWRGNIYRLDLMAMGYAGYTGNTSENNHKNIHNIGAIYDPAEDRVYGRRCKDIEDMQKNLDFWQPRGDYRYLYVLAANPELLTGRELWLSMGADAIRGTDYSVDGISFFGWGKHGIRGGSNIRVKDCTFDVIGGSIHEYEKRWVRFGNGVEFWADQAVNNEVSRCRFFRIYDTATTIQGPMSIQKESRCSDIHFHHNLMVGCRQDFEVWINSADGLMPQNCSFTHNRGYDSGANGFDIDNPNNTHLLHYILSPYGVNGILIEDNVFTGGDGLYYASTALDNMAISRNVFRCSEGDPVILSQWDKIRICAPLCKDGIWHFAEGLNEDSSVIMGTSHSRREALGRFEAFINSLTGGSTFKIKLK